MIDIRGGILAITICCLISLAADCPRPISTIETPYCKVDVLFAKKGLDGEMYSFWTEKFGPCSEQDRFRDT